MMKSEVFNNRIGSPYDFSIPTLTRQQEREIMAELFEQLLLFDTITISTNRLNFALAFLISKLGINTVERLIDSGYIKIMVWTPVIVSGSGHQRDDGSVDESVVYGQPPVIAGAFSESDTDPEKNIQHALAHFQFHKDRKRIFIREALKAYVVPNGLEFSNKAADLVIDSYKNNNLQELGLPFMKEPDQLDVPERRLLLGLSHQVLETALLSQYGLKSFDNFEHYAICKQNLHNIGRAYNIVSNNDTILSLENLPNLKELFLKQQLGFETIFKLRHLPNAKFYRNWINGVGENFDAKEITAEYLNELNGNSKFFATSGGKFLRSLTMYGAGAALSALTTGSIVAGAGLGLLETFWLDSILKGKNPKMFIENIRAEIKDQESPPFVQKD